MTTPHEDVTSVIRDVQEYDMATLEPPISHPEDLATAAIEALRRDAQDRALEVTLNSDGFPTVASKSVRSIIDAILGPPNEVPE